jgi:hypothetical protein
MFPWEIQESFLRTAAEIEDSHSVPPHWEPFGKPQDLQPKCCVTIGKYRSQMAASCLQIVPESGTQILGTLWQASGPPAKMLCHHR